jgi:hypothetical protein
MNLTSSPVVTFLTSRHPAGPGVLELHIALVGDHRSDLRLHRDVVERDLEQLRVLQRKGFRRLRFLELLECAFGRHD